MDQVKEVLLRVRSPQEEELCVPELWDSELLGSARPWAPSTSSFSSEPILFTWSMLPRHSPSRRIWRQRGGEGGRERGERASKKGKRESES